ncbi:transcriptional regulator [Collimonas pratensis]|nr:transcriptional regulator [Collimonas pratensis]NKI70524.1 transcriptional regulator [Collimonas pratensis]
MSKKFYELEAKILPAARARSNKKFHAMFKEIPLSKLRHAYGQAQKALSAVQNPGQPTVMNLAQNADMYISSLRAHIEAMGGELDIIARFPEGAVKIQNFTALASAEI